MTSNDTSNGTEEEVTSAGAPAAFNVYVATHYPPGTVIQDPLWHAPRLFRAAIDALCARRATTEQGGERTADTAEFRERLRSLGATVAQYSDGYKRLVGYVNRVFLPEAGERAAAEDTLEYLRYALRELRKQVATPLEPALPHDAAADRSIDPDATMPKGSGSATLNMDALAAAATKWAEMPDSDEEGQAWWDLVNFVTGYGAQQGALQAQALQGRIAQLESDLKRAQEAASEAARQPARQGWTAERIGEVLGRHGVALRPSVCAEIAAAFVGAPAAAAGAVDDQREAALWRGLIGSARIRMMGSTGITKPDPAHYAHFEMEIWTTYGEPGKHDFGEENAVGIKWLTRYAEIATLAARARKDGGQ